MISNEIVDCIRKFFLYIYESLIFVITFLILEYFS